MIKICVPVSAINCFISLFNLSFFRFAVEPVRRNAPNEQVIYTSNYDGAGKSKIPVSLPAGRTFRSIPVHAALSPDGKKLFFEVYESTTSTYFIYSCLIDGSNLQIVHGGSQNLIGLINAY